MLKSQSFFHLQTEKYFHGVHLDSQTPVNHNQLEFEEFLDAHIVESVVVFVDVVIGVVFSFVLEKNLIERFEYVTETNIRVTLKVADSQSVSVSVLAFSCGRKFFVDIG